MLHSIWGFPGISDGKESACNAGDLGSILGQEDPQEKDIATHSSILASILACHAPMDTGAWQATVHGMAVSRT